ncbi:hypothetical protein EXIGLDRAFT_724607 [Exidia glandulosa HHB12029]|uniref:Uncharacterized protein n=1 Tax=Exidia glandulosa HHB12029 TaxID=1314781 RepID=A0A165MPY8_EXIGL|nr:hypothetical protein EXIGLDRAFT_724607 [Exidia glandulosa HHB12029]
MTTPAMSALSAQQAADIARGRSRTRYPSHLTPGGVAKKPYLHRRGTSKTLESLEDLLREAGYKETRVFTTETEADAARDADQSAQSSRVSAVVGFIANLMPLSTRSLGRAAGHQVANAGAPTIRVDPTDSSSRASSRSSQRALSPACASTSSSVTIRPSSFLRPTTSSPAAAGPSSGQHRSLHPNTRAALLRHAASSPAMARSKSHSTPRRKRMVTTPNKVPPVPQLPDTWIAALTKALVGSPSSPLGDRTNGGSSGSFPIRIRVPSPAAGTVSRTNVTCRSTPASRSSSRAPPPFLLTITRTDNDGWSAPSADVSVGDDSLMDDEDDDSDGEVNLARILAPRPLARRQRSIVSLRRNLQTSMTQAREERRSRAGPGERTWGANDFDDEGFPVAAAQQRPGKKRRALPSWGPEDV